MGQYLPEVRKVFKLIETHKKDLEKAIKTESKLKPFNNNQNEHTGNK